MVFMVTPENLVNLIIIGTGIGVCLLSVMQIASSRHLGKVFQRYFAFFFLTLFLYISAHLARQIMDGCEGGAIRTALYAVTFFELLMSGLMAFMLSMLVVAAAHIEKHARRFQIIILVIFVGFILNLIVAQIGDLYYYFDASNVYHRSDKYILSNICPVLLLLLNAFILIRYRGNYIKRVRRALWVYLVAPVIAVVIQSVSYGIQFIILATVSAGAYMFSVIVRELNEQYEKQSIENSRIESELGMASNIQANMLPNIFPAFPERDEFSIYASMNPAKEIGGDFYDFFLIDDDHLGLVMADVSGKGVPAALFMMISKTLVQNYTMMGHSPKNMLEIVNRQICANNREHMFVTVWVGVLDLNSGTMVCGNAGHENPMLKQSDGHFEKVEDKHDFVVGGVSRSKYNEYELKLLPGAKLFLYTDGVPEATDAADQLFGMDRTLHALRLAEDETPQAILESVRTHVDEFVGEAPQFDDLTMLCLQYNGPMAEGGKKVHPLRVNND